MAGPRIRRIIKATVLVAVEGQSEKGYVRWLNRLAHRLERPAAFTDIVLGGGDPLELVEQTVALTRAMKKQGRQFDITLLLLDADRLGINRAKDDQAYKLAAQNALGLIWQRPCHEAFLLRHFAGYETRQPPDEGEAIRILREVWPDYQKGHDAHAYDGVLREEHLSRARNFVPGLDTLLRAVNWL